MKPVVNLALRYFRKTVTHIIAFTVACGAGCFYGCFFWHHYSFGEAVIGGIIFSFLFGAVLALGIMIVVFSVAAIKMRRQ